MRRRNRAGLKRIGLLALALVLALGALGTAYSVWTEDLYINSTVQLGTVDIDVSGCSSTFVYKVTGAPDTGYGPETVVHRVFGSSDPDPVGTLIASSVATTDFLPDADSATMTFTGIFPGIDFRTDVLLEYVGTIPVRISLAEITPTGGTSGAALDALWTLGEATKDDPVRTGAWIDGLFSDDDGMTWPYEQDLLGLQLHQGNMVHVTMHVHLPEGDQYNGISGLGFTGLITVIQYNEYEEP